MAAVRRHEIPKSHPVMKISSTGSVEVQPTPGHKQLQQQSTNIPTKNGKENEAMGQYFFHQRRGFNKGMPNFKKRNVVTRMDQ